MMGGSAMPILHIVAVKAQEGVSDERMEAMFQSLHPHTRMPHLVYDFVRV